MRDSAKGHPVSHTVIRKAGEHTKIPFQFISANIPQKSFPSHNRESVEIMCAQEFIKFLHGHLLFVPDYNQVFNRFDDPFRSLAIILELIRWQPRILTHSNPDGVYAFLAEEVADPFGDHDGNHDREDV